LQLGFGVMIDANKFTMYVNQIVNVVSNETSISILENLVNDNVELADNDKLILRNFLRINSQIDS